MIANKMNYFKLYKKSFEIFFRNKSLWALSLIDFLFNIAIQVGNNLKENELYIQCVLLITSLFRLYVMLVVTGGLIYVAYQAIYGDHSSFEQAWSVGKANIKRMIGLFLYMIPPGLVFLFFGVLWYKNSDSIWLFFMFFLTLNFFSSVFTFGDCNIIVSNLKPRSAAKTGFNITISNLIKVLIIGGFNLLISYIPVVFLVLIVYVSPYRPVLPANLEVDFQIFRKLFDVPLIKITRQLMSLVTFPLNLIVYTLAYDKFIKEAEYPAIIQANKVSQSK